MANLLSVDWDYFFPNPLHNGETTRHDWLLYDWGHSEASLFIEPDLWYPRAASFLFHGLGLPQCSGFDGFWDQFTFKKDVVLYVADSHSQAAGVLDHGKNWKSIWNFDAHHDGGYKKNLQPKDLFTRGFVTCEDWFMIHRTKRYVRYPPWFTQWETAEPQPRVKMDRKSYDPTEMLPKFDAVFLCRSGAWVPPWCDEQFEQFMNLWCWGDIEQLDDQKLRRDWDAVKAHDSAAAMQVSMARARSSR